MGMKEKGASECQLVFVHVGKCGGTSVKKAWRTAGVEIHEVHIEPVKENAHARYIILLRDPIAREVSAFNWRVNLVVSARRPLISLPWVRWNWRWQRFQFDREYEILKRYGDINTLAEALYDGDTPNEEAVEDFRCIHHLKESIAF